MNPIDYWYQKYLKEKLTWEDIKTIERLINEVSSEYLDVFFVEGKRVTDEVYYSEILRRFNEQKVRK